MPALDDHPLRYTLNSELHARPFPSLTAPHVAAYLAVRPLGEAARRDRSVDLQQLRDLLAHYGAPLPAEDATHYFGPMGKYTLKWEQHTEFVTYTVFLDQLGQRPFDPAEFDVFPQDWRAGLNAQIAEALQDWFVPESLAVASVLEDAAVIASDFRIDPAGHMRMAVFASEGTGSRRLGRIVQRLCEIETYKSMSMLGFAKVREFAGQLDRIDAELNDLMAGMAGTSAMAEDTLHRLLDISVGLEALSADASYRLGATEAYQAIVAQRIGALRETRFMARQGFDEFMMRRYEPAMRTVTSSETRLNKMSARASRAAELLRTRVDVERSAQNQAILASMDKRSDLQLRLQHTVEGLSVVAISYYAVSLVGYMLYPLADRIVVSKGTLTAVTVPVVVLLVWGLLRRLRHKIK
ncbi:DUF3422 family protein [Sulfitobacter pontiacus]|uniref:DUF3422 family protein n=1 Tax=Sulfitobacter pontiacus TaxID=60137 RepID=UPI001046A53C|nr:DUF3422 domain-containing protein [Sulfitobacter pontiacus]